MIIADEAIGSSLTQLLAAFALFSGAVLVYLTARDGRKFDAHMLRLEWENERLKDMVAEMQSMLSPEQMARAAHAVEAKERLAKIEEGAKKP